MLFQRQRSSQFIPAFSSVNEPNIKIKIIDRQKGKVMMTFFVERLIKVIHMKRMIIITVFGHFRGTDVYSM